MKGASPRRTSSDDATSHNSCGFLQPAGSLHAMHPHDTCGFETDSQLMARTGANVDDLGQAALADPFHTSGGRNDFCIGQLRSPTTASTSDRSGSKACSESSAEGMIEQSECLPQSPSVEMESVRLKLSNLSRESDGVVRDFRESTLHVSTSSPCPRRLCEAPQCEQVTEVQISVGSAGHPHRCGLPCKFSRRPGHCKDKDQCTRCHLCKWSKGREKQKRAIISATPHDEMSRTPPMHFRKAQQSVPGDQEQQLPELYSPCRPLPSPMPLPPPPFVHTASQMNFPSFDDFADAYGARGHDIAARVGNANDSENYTRSNSSMWQSHNFGRPTPNAATNLPSMINIPRGYQHVPQFAEQKGPLGHHRGRFPEGPVGVRGAPDLTTCVENYNHTLALLNYYRTLVMLSPSLVSQEAQIRQEIMQQMLAPPTSQEPVKVLGMQSCPTLL